MSLFLLPQATEALCKPAGSRIFYGNGMFNTPEDAKYSLYSFQSAISVVPSIEKERGRVSYQLAYNQNETAALQILQVFQQKMGDKTEAFWRWMLELDPAPEWFKSAWRAAVLVNFALANSLTDDQDARSHINAYSRTLADGWRVLLLSHSQGNFYANHAAEALPAKTHGRLDEIGFGNVQVATPVDRVLSRGPWSTFPDDEVIAFIRTTLGALPSNLRGPGASPVPDGDPHGHGFVLAYLKSSESRAKIGNDMAMVAQNTSYPTSGITAFRISLQTTISSGIELHVRKPSGKEFMAKFEENEQDQSMLYDYREKCGEIEAGEYQIFLDSWGADKGSAPVLNVVIGSGEARTFRPKFQRHVRADGEADPTHARYLGIRVQKDPISGEVSASILEPTK